VAALKQTTSSNDGFIMKRKLVGPDATNSPAPNSQSAPTPRTKRTPQKVTPEYLRSLGMPNPKSTKG
jgi:hypothetical protein